MQGPWQKYQQPSLGRPIIREPAPQPSPQTAPQRRKDELNVIDTSLGIQDKRESIAERKRKQQEDAGKAEAMRESATGDLLRVIQRLDRVALDANDNKGWFETGALGAVAGAIPGTAARDIRRDLDMVGSNAAIETLMRMRQESPTGAGVGNVALGELQLMKDKYGIFDPSQGHDSFMQNVAEGKREFFKILRKVNPKAAERYWKIKPVGVWTKGGRWVVGKPGGAGQVSRGASPRQAPRPAPKVIDFNDLPE